MTARMTCAPWRWRRNPAWSAATVQAGLWNVVSVPDGAPAVVREDVQADASQDRKFSYLRSCQNILQSPEFSEEVRCMPSPLHAVTIPRALPAAPLPAVHALAAVGPSSDEPTSCCTIADLSCC
jgi:hypothetical protein